MRSQYGLIVVWVVVVASIFVGAFFIKFGSWPTSNDAADWADFATYLSGTVGVTAVLGTLFSVVRTLGQQHDLVESQRVMLDKQEEQIRLTNIQLENEKINREIGLAYENVKSILPMMVEYLERYMAQPIEIPSVFRFQFNESYYANNIARKRDIFKRPTVLNKLYEESNEIIKKEIELYIVTLMGPCTRIYGFLFK